MNAFERQIKKERAIGVDPIYDHSRGRTYDERMAARAEWLKLEKEYDDAN